MEEDAPLLESSPSPLLSLTPSQIQAGRLGFYLANAALETFAIVSVTLFLPVTLEEYSRQNGFLKSDLVTRCISDKTQACAVKLLGSWIDTTSFSLYVFSISVATQALLVISIGTAAIQPSRRISLFSTLTLIGAASACLFIIIPIDSPFWSTIALCTIVANTCMGAAIVCMNAFLPSLAEGMAQENGEPGSKEAITKASAVVSARGIALGFAGGISGLLLAMLIVSRDHSPKSLGRAIFLSGFIWLGFGIPAAYLFRQIAPPNKHVDQDSFLKTVQQSWTWLFTIFAWRHKLSQAFVYLLAWVFMSDSLSTITSTAMLFGKTVIGMSTSSLVVLGILTPLSGILGALFFPLLQTRVLGISDTQLLVLLLILAQMIPLYAFFALHTPGEMYMLACYFGVMYGALSSYNRTVFASLVPKSQIARWFALYSITDKSSSFFGPLIVGLITEWTGSIRYGFLYLSVALVIPLPILLAINGDEGIEQAHAVDAEEHFQET